MLTTLVPEFLKNVFSLLEPSNGAETTNNDEKVIEYIFGFIMEVFKNMEGSIISMRLSSDFKKSMVVNLESINEELLKTVAYLDPSTKMTIENLSLRMALYNVSKRRSVFDKDNGSALINLDEPFAIESKKYFRELKPVARNNIQDSSISSSVSFDSTLRANHYTDEELKAELEDYKVHCLTVPKCSISNAASVGITGKETLNIAVLEFSDLVLVEGNFAIDKMLWHSVVNKHNGHYHCLVCSKDMWNETDYNNHILAPLHLTKLSMNKVWIPSSQMCANIINDKSNKSIQCCICSDMMDNLDMEKHLKSSKHLRSNQANYKGETVLSQLTQKTLKESTTKQVNTFKNLHGQHEIKINGKEITCGICIKPITSDQLENLYVHISGQRHRKLYDNSLKSKFDKTESIFLFKDAPGKSYRGFIHMYDNKNLSYCIICNVLINGSTLDEVKEHITSDSHSSLLTLYLTKHKLPPPKNLNINRDANKDLELYNPEIKQFANTCVQNKPIYEPKVIWETANKVFLDCNIQIDKCSWNGMKQEYYQYYCCPCRTYTEIKNFAKHISSDLHKQNIKDWYITKEYPTIKKANKTNSIFCMSCKEELHKDLHWLLHVNSEEHKKQSEKLNVDSKELKKLVDKIQIISDV